MARILSRYIAQQVLFSENIDSGEPDIGIALAKKVQEYYEIEWDEWQEVSMQAAVMTVVRKIRSKSDNEADKLSSRKGGRS